MRCAVRWSCPFRCRRIVYKCELNELFGFWMPAHDENNDVIDFVQFDRWHQGLQQTSRIQHESLNWKRKNHGPASKEWKREQNRATTTERKRERNIAFKFRQWCILKQCARCDLNSFACGSYYNSSLNVTKYNTTRGPLVDCCTIHFSFVFVWSVSFGDVKTKEKKW